jgi:hypothetical protein
VDLHRLLEDVPRDAKLILESTNIVQKETKLALIQFPHRNGIDHGLKPAGIVLDETIPEATIDGLTYRLEASSTTPGYSAWNLMSYYWGGEPDPDDWMSAPGKYNSDGLYIGNAALGGYSGEYVIFTVPYELDLHTIRFQNSKSATKRAASITVLISKDKVSWTHIATRTTLNFTYESRELDITVDRAETFKHLAIVFDKSEKNTDGQVAFNNLVVLGYKQIIL